MQQQFFDPQRIFVENIPFLIRTHMHTVHIDLAVFYADKRFLDAAFALAHGFDLRAVEGDARLITLLYKIVVVGFFIVGDQFLCFFLFCHSLISPDMSSACWSSCFAYSARSKSTVRSRRSVPATCTVTGWPRLKARPVVSPTIS